MQDDRARVQDSISLLALGATGCGFLLAGGRGRVSELALLAIAAAGAHFVSPAARRGAAIGAVVAYVVSEGFFGRLDGGSAWWQFVLATGVVATVLAARRRPAERATADSRAGADRPGHRSTSLDYELGRARRGDHELAVVLLAVDGEGTDAPWLLDAIGDSLRATDIPLLDETHELALVLPETGALEARIAAERLRLALGDAGTSISLGVAAFPHDGSTSEELIGAATRALEHARTVGGGRTVLHSVPAGTPGGWGLEPTQVGRRYGF
jgi:hypothetical protein